jgi:hypothetical protein
MVSKILFLIELISDLSAMAPPSCHLCPQDMPLDSIRAMIIVHRKNQLADRARDATDRAKASGVCKAPASSAHAHAVGMRCQHK